jgi:serine O-acetyltransferase
VEGAGVEFFDIQYGSRVWVEGFVLFTLLKKYIKSDLYRYAGRTGVSDFAKYYFRNSGFKYVFWLRLAKSAIPGLRHVARLMHRNLSRKYLIQIPLKTEIGFGLLLPHGLCIVINSGAKIGDNCTIGHFVTIGSQKREAAIIGNDVFIGPGSTLVERVHIGDGATVGAGSVVTKDVATGDTVAGNPARTISEKRAGRLIKNRWEEGGSEVLRDAPREKALDGLPAILIDHG